MFDKRHFSAISLLGSIIFTCVSLYVLCLLYALIWILNLLHFFLKADGMKFWFMWKSRGSFGLRKSVDLAMSCAEYFFGVLENRQGFRLVLPHFECTNICFW